MDIETRIIFETIHGSRAYGLDTATSDTDRKGIAIPDKTVLLGFLEQFAQQDRWPDDQGDRVIFSLVKFFALASQSNPNVLEILFTEPRFHLHITALGEELLAHRQDFLSQKAISAFHGYAISQLNRIRRHRQWLLQPLKKAPEREDFNLPAGQKLIDSSANGAFNALFAELLRISAQHHEQQEFIKQYCDPHSADYQDWIGLVQKTSAREPDFFDRFGEVIAEALSLPVDMLALLSREKAWQAAVHNWEQYQQWKRHRNPARAELEARFGYDCKHAMHLVRLIKMGGELLATGNLQVYRKDDREELLGIRQGQWHYEKLLEYAESRQAALKKILAASPLPVAPDKDQLNILCWQLQEKMLQVKY